MFKTFFSTAIATAALAAAAAPLTAADRESAARGIDVAAARPDSPISRLRSWWHDALAPIKEREAVQMLSAVLSGSQMGPGDGWFHPGQSRYGWDWLAERYDTDKNGVVSKDELAGYGELFERLDRDHDGELKAEDFDWSEKSPFIKQQGMAGQLFARVDHSSNGRVSQEEWQKFFEKLAGEKGYVSREDLRAGLFPPPPNVAAMAARAAEGPAEPTLIKGILSGELGSICEGPRIGAKAPDFELETEDGKQKVHLADFRGKKPVVLIFGSFT